MSQTSFTLKSLEIQVTLGVGDFGAGGNTKIYNGLACEVRIEKPGLPDKNKARVRLWGISPEDMGQLTRLAWEPLENQKNILVARAGDEGTPLSEAFRGEITTAYAVFRNAPDVYMQFEALSGYYPQLIAASPVSVQGEAQAAQLVEQFATEAGYTFENQGVTSSVRNAVFNGSPIAKMQAVAAQVGAELIIDDDVVILKQPEQARAGNAILINAANGMIGYPEFTQDGIACSCLYKPDIQYGGLIRIESEVPRATGTWKVSRLTHTLSAYRPEGGAWQTQIEASYVQ